MARLNNLTYYAHHYFVHEVWVNSWASWSKLSPGEQWDLHCFYSARRPLSTEGLKEFRKQAVATDPSLPQRAGRAFKKLEAAYAAQIAVARERAAHPVPVEPAKKRQSKDRMIRVTSLVHPEPDMQKLVNALIALAKELESKGKTFNNDKDNDEAFD